MQDSSTIEDLEQYKNAEKEETPRLPENKQKKSDLGNSSKPVPDLNHLSYVRLIDPVHIPSYLVEQIKDRLYSVEQFYKYQKVACIIQTSEGPTLNGANLLYAITHNRLRQVKGFLWMVIDFLTNSLVINNFSMDKEYWHKGTAIGLLEKKAKSVMKDLKLSRIVWITKNYKFCENQGYKKSKNAVMVYEEGE